VGKLVGEAIIALPELTDQPVQDDGLVIEIVTGVLRMYVPEPLKLPPTLLANVSVAMGTFIHTEAEAEPPPLYAVRR